MDKITLQTTKRTTLGKKCKALRRQGITPVHVFGHGIQSLALECTTPELKKALAQAGRTALIDLKTSSSSKPCKVLVREVQKRYDNLLHVDFYQVRLTEKITIDVPIILVGEAPAAKSKDAMVLQTLSSIAVECLPTDVPHNIAIDVTVLEDLDQAILVKDIVLSDDVTTVTDPDQVIVKVSRRVMEKAEEAMLAAEVAEGVTEGAETATESITDSDDGALIPKTE